MWTASSVALDHWWVTRPSILAPARLWTPIVGVSYRYQLFHYAQVRWPFPPPPPPPRQITTRPHEGSAALTIGLSRSFCQLIVFQRHVDTFPLASITSLWLLCSNHHLKVPFSKRTLISIFYCFETPFFISSITSLYLYLFVFLYNRIIVK